jgi:hypothetical protein
MCYRLLAGRGKKNQELDLFPSLKHDAHPIWTTSSSSSSFFLEREEGWTTQPSNQAGFISIRGQSYFGGPVTIWKEK